MKHETVSVQETCASSNGAAATRTPTDLARLFHDTYERHAPAFGYETRADTKAFDPLTPNGQLMIRVCDIVASAIRAEQRAATLAECINVCLTASGISVATNALLRMREEGKA